MPTRRTFLAATAAATAGGLLLKHAHAQPVPDDEKVGFAIAGLGGYALNQILPNIANTRLCKVTALVTGDPDTKGRRVAEQYGVPRENVVTYDTIDQLRDRAGVDVLYVITPTGLHMQHTLAGFDAGLHVLCEKPMATDVAQCDRMIAAAEAAGRWLMIGYRVHYEPHNLRAMELAANGHVGPLRHFTGDISYNRRSDGSTWREDYELAGRGGPLMDLGVYMVNAARYITAAEPTRVAAYTHRPEGDPRFPPGIEARCTWQLEFPGNVTASSSTAYDMTNTNHFRVIGRDGWFAMEPATGYGGHRLLAETRGRDRGPADDIPAGNQFAAQLDHFAQCIKENRKPDTPGEEGRADVKVMRRIYEAAEAGEWLDV
ncbi:MAG: Gfo/Idh/MocA family oxidoreductase [Planctomycetota bacterium]